MVFPKQISGRITASFFVALFAFVVYITTAPKGLSWDLGGADSGELAAAVLVNGLVHSPGYPTYLLLGQLVKWFPIGSFALRLVIFSALAAATTTGVLVYISWEQQKRFQLIAAITTGLVWGLNELVWTQAVIVEVYALASTFSVFLLFISLSIKHDSKAAYWVLGGIVLGAGIGSHYLIGFVAVFATLWLILHKQLGKQQILYAVVGAILGLGVFLWLPLRAGEVLLSNWGNPNTFRRFWWVVSGAAFADRLDLWVDPLRIASLLGLIARQLTPVGVLLIIFGFKKWWEEERGWVLVLSLIHI